MLIISVCLATGNSVLIRGTGVFLRMFVNGRHLGLGRFVGHEEVELGCEPVCYQHSNIKT